MTNNVISRVYFDSNLISQDFLSSVYSHYSCVQLIVFIRSWYMKIVCSSQLAFHGCTTWAKNIFTAALYTRDVRNLILRPETITNMSLYVGFELRNQNQHAWLAWFETKIETNFLLLSIFEIKIKTNRNMLLFSKSKPQPISFLFK